MRAACDAAAAAKARGGLPFAAVTGAVAGGLLPEIAKWIAERKAARQPGGRGAAIAFNTAFFAFDGVVIDLLYRFEARLFGHARRPWSWWPRQRSISSCSRPCGRWSSWRCSPGGKTPSR